MNLSLIGKNALVGGSSSGIGKAVAIELAALGANVTLMSRTESSLKKVIEVLDINQGQNHDYLVVDYANAADLKQQITTLTNRKPIHILINNTGGPPVGLMYQMTLEQLSQAYNNHLVCNHILAQAVIKSMKANQYGRIINITSTSVKEPMNNLGLSNTIRGAVANWAKTLANELAKYGITVNNVLPGATNTGRLNAIFTAHAQKQGIDKQQIIQNYKAGIPMARFAKPKEIANVVAFLASPAASYVTGINIPVDGGRTKSL